MMNKFFKRQIKNVLEIYIDNIIVKNNQNEI